VFIQDAHYASCFFGGRFSSCPPCSALLPLDVGMDRSKRKEKWGNDHRWWSRGWIGGPGEERRGRRGRRERRYNPSLHIRPFSLRPAAARDSQAGPGCLTDLPRESKKWTINERRIPLRTTNSTSPSLSLPPSLPRDNSRFSGSITEERERERERVCEMAACPGVRNNARAVAEGGIMRG